MENKETKRTNQQNKAMHLFYRQMSEMNNSMGLDQRKVFDAIRPGIDIPWDDEGRQFKENIWRPIMKAVTGKDSTTELTTTEIDKVLEVIAKFYSEKFDVAIEFPSMETLIARIDNLRRSK